MDRDLARLGLPLSALIVTLLTAAVAPVALGGGTAGSTEAPAPPRGTFRHTEVPLPELRFMDDLGAAPEATVFSLPSRMLTAGEVLPFLTAVRALDPARRVLVLTDAPLLGELAGHGDELGLTLLDAGEHGFSPWPRDPLSFTWGPDGGLVIVERPDLQAGREADFEMGRALLDALPEALDQAWGKVRWTRSPWPFHGGQFLVTTEALWLSLHTIEPRILALLGRDRVPVESFGTEAGIDAYLGAARQAAGELARAFGRPARFVHPLPEAGPLAPRSRAMAALGGGAGFDLDSWMTLLPGREGRRTALVADVKAGRRLLEALPTEDLALLASTYGLAPSGEDLRRLLLAAQAARRSEALAAFLDLAAGELARQGLTVERLPLLRVPTALLADRERFSQEDFLLTWNNVVVSQGATGCRAEGFASRLPAADRRAEEIYAAAGCRLTLLPPLVESIRLNGGYRCASNHLRPRARPEPVPEGGEGCSERIYSPLGAPGDGPIQQGGTHHDLPR